jgi:hypothetical protein
MVENDTRTIFSNTATLDYIDRWTAKLTRQLGDKTQHNDSRD